ncbi:Utp8 family [Microdochium nivale]|nr:Utp8 family [Microdochium nivale]
MASHFQIQKPYVLATLPRPVDPTTGRYVVGNVYGSLPGSRKRKRSELAIGTDGDSMNIYDVSSSRLVTSYPIPPQSSFSCPAYSVRCRVPESKDVSRYTYVATHDAPENTITLFKDYVDAAGKTTATTKTFVLGIGSPVVFLTRTSTAADEEEILLVRANGEVISLDPETLQKRWQSPPSTLKHGLESGSLKEDIEIEFCSAVPIADVVQGIFKGNAASFSLFPASAVTKESTMEVLVLVSRSGSQRHIHVAGVLSSKQNALGLGQKIASIHVAPLKASRARSPDQPKPLYHLDARSGQLLELVDDILSTFDLTLSTPRPASTIELEDATSFLRLTQTSLLSAADSKLDIYNPLYRSLQSSTPLEIDTNNNASNQKISLVSYFSKIELAIAIVDSSLVAIQLEAPKARSKKRRAEGLLVDSLGRGINNKERYQSSTSVRVPKPSAFSNYLPGSLKDNYWDIWKAEEARADILLAENYNNEFEALLAEKFGLRVIEEAQVNGTAQPGETKASAPITSWKWPKSRDSYQYADRRWVLYGISRAFNWNAQISGEETIPQLTCQLPQSNLVYYLVDAGHLTLSNVKAAFRESLGHTGKSDAHIAEQVVQRLAELDPSLELLTAYLSATTLNAVELLIAVRTLMRSLELVQDPRRPPPKLLTDGSVEHEQGEERGGEEKTEAIEQMEIDSLEAQVEKAESYLNGDGGIRGNGLSVAFAKLASCPNITTIKTLRTTFKPEEILSLIYLLRVELVKGAWTSRYLDTTDFEQNADLDAPPDNIIKLIADLLSRCVDSLGPGGWLLNDAILAGDESGDFISSLKLEVSAALEGLEEAVYLRGIVGETVKYAEAAAAVAHLGVVTQAATAPAPATAEPSTSTTTTLQQSTSGNSKVLLRPVALHVREPGSDALPLGLKTRQQAVAATKVVSGGEILKRSGRETGHLRSQQVGAYSLERIAI